MHGMEHGFGMFLGGLKLKSFSLIWQNNFLDLFAIEIGKKRHPKLNDPLEIRAAKKFQWVLGKTDKKSPLREK